MRNKQTLAILYIQPQAYIDNVQVHTSKRKVKDGQVVYTTKTGRAFPKKSMKYWVKR